MMSGRRLVLIEPGLIGKTSFFGRGRRIEVLLSIPLFFPLPALQPLANSPYWPVFRSSRNLVPPMPRVYDAVGFNMFLSVNFFSAPRLGDSSHTTLQLPSDRVFFLLLAFRICIFATTAVFTPLPTASWWLIFGFPCLPTPIPVLLELPEPRIPATIAFHATRTTF